MFPSTISSVTLLIVKALDAEGINSDEVLRKTGIDPSRLKNPNARYAYPAMTRLWKAAVEITGNECFGLKAASFTHPTTLHALGCSFVASSSLFAASRTSAGVISRIQSKVLQSLG